MISKGAVVVLPPWFLTRPSTSSVSPQSETDVEVISDGIHQVGQGRVGAALAASSSRRSSDSSLRMIGPRPQARRRPAARRSWDDMIALLLEITAHADDSGRSSFSGTQPVSSSTPRRSCRRPDAPARAFALNPSLGFCGT